MAVVRALREAGHDVTAISEVAPSMADEDVSAMASADRRILLTEDRDFGRLFHAGTLPAEGVIYIRFRAGTRAHFPAEVCEFVDHHGDGLAGMFVVMQPGRTRISRLPDGQP